MKLKIKDRLLIAQLCPNEADILTQTVAKGILVKVEISQKEIEVIELKPRPSGQGLTWKDDKAEMKNITFSTAELSILKAEVGKLDKNKKITQDMLSICIKIQDEKSPCSKIE